MLCQPVALRPRKDCDWILTFPSRSLRSQPELIRLIRAQARLGHLRGLCPSLVHVSLRDEYIPASVDKEQLLALFSTHMPEAVVKVDSEANHNLSQPPGASERFADDGREFETMSGKAHGDDLARIVGMGGEYQA